MEKKRVCKTNLQVKHDMYEALVRLLQEKSLSAVNVSDLTTAAKVSRMSFYRNYDTIEDILKEHLDEVVEEYRGEDSRIAGDDRIKLEKEYMEHCFNFLYRHRDFLNTIINCGLGDLFLAKITEYLTGKWMNGQTDIQKEVEMSAFAGAIYNIYRFWRKNSFRQSPQELAQILCCR